MGSSVAQEKQIHVKFCPTCQVRVVRFYVGASPPSDVPKFIENVWLFNSLCVTFVFVMGALQHSLEAMSFFETCETCEF